MTQVKGMKELAQFMHQLPDKLEKNIMRGGLRAGAKVLAAEAEKNVPVDEGDLKKSLKVSTSNKRGVVTASVKATDFKAKWIEYGTGAHWISVKTTAKPTRLTRGGMKSVSTNTLNNMARSGSLRIGTHFVGASVAHPGSKAHPFLRPALDSKATEAVVAMANYIKLRLASKHGMDTSGVTVEAEE